jgi:hypothetical protein
MAKLTMGCLLVAAAAGVLTIRNSDGYGDSGWLRRPRPLDPVNVTMTGYGGGRQRSNS